MMINSNVFLYLQAKERREVDNNKNIYTRLKLCLGLAAKVIILLWVRCRKCRVITT